METLRKTFFESPLPIYLALIFAEVALAAVWYERRGRRMWLAMLTPPALAVIVFGIVGGIFTTTEAAVVAVVYGFLVGMFIYREISLRDIPGILAKSAELATVIMFIQTTAFLFAWLITVHQVPALLAETLMRHVAGPAGCVSGQLRHAQ